MTLDRAFLSTPLAHRAYHNFAKGIPENSRVAVQAAIDAGYGIEVDVQLSADGHAMVFHDYDLARLTHQAGPIQQRTAAELGDIQLKGGDEGIPMLDEILEIVGGRVPLLVEIKDQDGAMGARVGRLEKATATAITGYGGPIAVMGFNPNSVRAMMEHAPGVPRGLTTCSYTQEDWQLLPRGTRDRLREIPDYDIVGASFISHQFDDLSRPRVQDLKLRGATVLCWTIRSAAQERHARQVADNITFEGYAASLTVQDNETDQAHN